MAAKAIAAHEINGASEALPNTSFSQKHVNRQLL
jgi:hypothetical protein